MTRKVRMLDLVIVVVCVGAHGGPLCGLRLSYLQGGRVLRVGWDLTALQQCYLLTECLADWFQRI